MNTAFSPELPFPAVQRLGVNTQHILNNTLRAILKRLYVDKEYWKTDSVYDHSFQL